MVMQEVEKRLQQKGKEVQDDAGGVEVEEAEKEASIS